MTTEEQEEWSETNKLALAAIAASCRSFLKTYDEFSPEYIDSVMSELGDGIESLQVSLTNWANIL